MKTLALISIAICILVIWLLAPQFVEATPIQYNTGALPFSWTTLNNAIVLDTNFDGTADTVYTYNALTTSTVVYTKEWGSGSSSFSCVVTIPNNFKTEVLYFGNDGYFYQTVTSLGGATNDLTTTAAIVDFQAGTCAGQPSTSDAGVEGCVTLCYGVVFHLPNQTRITAHGGDNLFEVYNNSTQIVTGGLTGFLSPQGIYLSSGCCDPWLIRSNGDILNGTIPIPNTIPLDIDKTLIQYYGTACSSVCFYDSFSTTMLGSGMLSYQPTINSTLFGMKALFNNTNALTTNQTSWIGFFNASKSNEILLSLPESVYGITPNGVRFYLQNGGITYIGVMSPGNVLKYSLMPSLTSYNWQRFILDNSTGKQSSLLTTGKPSDVVLIRSESAQTSTNVTGLFMLTSGYDVSVSGIQRAVDPRWLNDTSLKPIIIDPITSQTNLAIQFLNTPTDAAVDYRSTLTFGGVTHTWSSRQIEASKTSAVDLPSNTCVEIFIRDISVSNSIWLSLGNVCNTGTMPKSISFLTDLPVTFWVLQYGASHTYTPSSNNLLTTTRSSTIPFTYNVIVKNSTGAVSINQTFVSASVLDMQNFNVSSVTKPASLSISVGSSQIYSAYLGASVSLASVASFFHQYFSYQGFDLISFIPIIFAAMFTRNTVGLGTVLVVVCIATISWLSIVVVPDTYIFIMAVISVIGLIGYRLAYPN